MRGAHTPDPDPPHPVPVQEGSSRVWYEAGSHPGEPIFVPAPPGPDGSSRPEDEGVLLSVVMSAAGSSYLLLLQVHATVTRGVMEG